MNWTVYIIENEASKLYIGATSNLLNRLRSHNLDKGSDWTQGKGPWRIIYKELFQSKPLALRRENKLKSLKAGQRIKSILNIS